jgi:hypothetical protein
MARFKKGDYKVVCDRSGAVVNASDCRMQWNGLYVLKELWEQRHPLDTPPNARPERPPPISRPEGEIQFISAVSVTGDDL